MSLPKISVLIPICNVEEYLEECLESVARQTLKDIEVICINDGSKDRSLDIINRYVEKYSNFKLLDKENSGYGDSMNRGIEMATGDYIGIVESDDIAAPKMFEELYALTVDGTVDIVKGNFWNFFEKNGKKHFVENDDRNMVPSSKEPFTIYEKPQLLFGHPSIWSAIYRREFIEKNSIRFMPEPGGGWTDNPFFFETFLLADSIQWTKKPYYKYRKTNPNSSTNKQPDLTLAIRRMIDNLNVLEKYNINDEQLLVMTYARALMYINGVKSERFYFHQKDEIYKYARLMLQKINPEVLYRNFNQRDIAFYYEHLNELENKMPQKEKVLIYNWVPFANESGWGGGVNIYCENLVRTILKNSPNVDVYFLSSGFAYDISRTDCYIRMVGNIFGDKCKSFEIVNSPVPAAVDCILNRPSVAYRNNELKELFFDFIEKNGDFKAIHFNNIEGLSLDCLELKPVLKNTKMIYSMHNYVPTCLHGFYYNRAKSCVCSNKHTSDECAECIKKYAKKNVIEDIYGRALMRYKNGEEKLGRDEWIDALGFSDLEKAEKNIDYTEYCKRATEALNNNMDQILAVSNRVKEIAIDNGFDPEKTVTSYIGTKVAEFQHRKKVYNPKKRFTVVYLGANYNQVEKGYPFLMDALGTIKPEEASKIDLVLTTTNGDENAMKSILRHFRSVKVIHGYNHLQLRDILLNCDLGVVPVLWEDNLPQIAIEMSANGVPVLASDLGGASELCSSELFTFEGGNAEQFKEKLLKLVHNPELLEEYWKNHKPLVTMDAHWEEMKAYYGVGELEEVVLSSEEYRRLVEQNRFLIGAAQNMIIDRSKIGRVIMQGKDYHRKFWYYFKAEGMSWTLKAGARKMKKILKSHM